MSCDIVVGLQYGDEGKGKIVDALSNSYDTVVRYQGGSNAGHTIYVDDKKYVLHIIPTGILHNKTSVITHGCVINPEELVREINLLEILGFDIRKNLLISEDVHVTTRRHLIEDNQNKELYGSTGKGIGPTYRDKVYRKGLRLKDVIKSYPELRRYMTDTSYYLRLKHDLGENILFEGAQAFQLDVDFGTYPYVTSSPCTANYVPQASGMPLSCFSDASVVGVVKAYTTRIAVGPFRSEMDKQLADKFREKGGEYGATTGRPRRIGWLDLKEVKKACEVNGVTQIALTKVDVLENEDVKLMRRANTLTFKPWSYNGETKFDDFDENLKKYITVIEDELGVPVSMIGVGPNRDQIVYR